MSSCATPTYLTKCDIGACDTKYINIHADSFKDQHYSLDRGFANMFDSNPVTVNRDYSSRHNQSVASHIVIFFD